MMKKYLCIMFCTLGLGIWGAREASAWEQAYTCDDVYVMCMEGKSPLPTYWAKPCVEMHLNEAGSRYIDFEDVQRVVKDSIETWNVPERSSLVMSYGGLTNETRVGYNPCISENANIIVFRDDVWNESSAIMALTSVTNRASNGLIYDADMEINTAMYNFGIVDRRHQNFVDLQNTVTHELGHVIGLEHSTDSESTMYAYALAGTIYMRDLGEDDLEGLETIYPRSSAATCSFLGEYFEAPPQAMNEGCKDKDGSCSALPSQKVNKKFGFGLLLGMGCLGLYFVRRRKDVVECKKSR